MHQRGALQQYPERPCGSLGVRNPKGLLPLRGSKIHLRFPVAREFYGWLIIATSTSGDARRVTTFERKHRQAARRVVSTAPPACGWLRGTSRTSPGPPRRWRRPVRLQGTSARGRGFAAYLSACGGQPLQRPRCGLRQGGLRSLRSASSLPFLVTCQRQVIPSHSFAARTRAYCAPRKWSWTPTNARMYQPPRDPEGRRARTRQRHLAARRRGPRRV